MARQWFAAHPAPPIPAASGDGKSNPIDAFLTAKVQQALAASTAAASGEGKAFYDDVLPVLTDRCFRCHGEKVKGDLRLNTREAAILAGTSGNPSIVPGDLSKSELIKRIRSADPDERMPSKGE